MMTFEDVWKSMIALQSAHVFHTARGLPYTFTISGGVIKLSRKANPITRATVELAYRNAVHGTVPGPKALRCFGASYLYPIFQTIGVIDSKSSKNTNRVDEHTDMKGMMTMPRPKGSRNKPALTIDEQITQATAKVETLKAELEAAEAELKKLETLRDEEQVKELMSAIASSGKSVADVIAMLKGE